jgi:GTP-binding protein
MSKKSFIISIIGRPNVGKSTLYNRLITGKAQAIALNFEGVTRDLNFNSMNLERGDLSLSATLVDSGGFFPQELQEDDDRDHFYNLMASQAKLAIEESDLVLFMTDIRAGLNPFDQQIYKYLNKQNKTNLVVCNKFDSEKLRGQEVDFYQMGVAPENLILVSAEHGNGIYDLEDRILTLYEESLKQAESEEQVGGTGRFHLNPHAIIGSVAIIGAPNVGKSTFLNNVVGSERSLVSDRPGTTIDPVTSFRTVDIKRYLKEHELKIYLEKELVKQQPKAAHLNDLEQSRLQEEESGGELEAEPIHENYLRCLKFVDTAGIRRKTYIAEELEWKSVYRSIRAINESDMVFFIVDAMKGVTHQDRRLIGLSLEKGKAVSIGINKFDLWKEQNPKKSMQDLKDIVSYKVPWLEFCDWTPLSALTGQNVSKTIESIVRTLYSRRISLPTAALNRCMQRSFEKNPVMISGRKGGSVLKLKYVTQVKSGPPTLLLYTNKSKEIPQQYRRYLINQLRSEFKMSNTPIHLIFR